MTRSLATHRPVRRRVPHRLHGSCMLSMRAAPSTPWTASIYICMPARQRRRTTTFGASNAQTAQAKCTSQGRPNLSPTLKSISRTAVTVRP